jgi:hypothetical protein
MVFTPLESPHLEDNGESLLNGIRSKSIYSVAKCVVLRLRRWSNPARALKDVRRRFSSGLSDLIAAENYLAAGG